MYLLATCLLFVNVLYLSTALTNADPCNLNCPSGQRCELNQVLCKRNPCPPIPICVDVSPTQLVKAGSCPAPIPDQGGICAVQCFGDDSCPGNQKCCGSCPKTCTEPGNLPEKPGRCPPRMLRFLGGWCSSFSDQCTFDTECGGWKKCCNTGCGYRCSRPFLDIPT